MFIVHSYGPALLEMKVAEKNLEELPKNADVHFLTYWRWKNLDAVENVLSS